MRQTATVYDPFRCLLELFLSYRCSLDIDASLNRQHLALHFNRLVVLMRSIQPLNTLHLGLLGDLRLLLRNDHCLIEIAVSSQILLLRFRHFRLLEHVDFIGLV